MKEWNVYAKDEIVVPHRCFLPSFGSFGQMVSEEKNLKNQPIRNKSCLWRTCLLPDRDEMSNLYRGFSIDASCQVSFHLAEGFQRRRLKCEKLTDEWRQTTDANWWLMTNLNVCSAHSCLYPWSRFKNLTNIVIGKLGKLVHKQTVLTTFFYFINCKKSLKIPKGGNQNP